MQAPLRILFVCHGNICRSTMAHFVMQDLVNQADLADRFVIDSAATTTEELGNPIYPPARAKLVEKGVPILNHHARQVRAGEWADWDIVAIMDSENERHLSRIWGPAHMDKVSKLLAFADINRDVADPWYTRDFDKTYQDVVTGCTALLDRVRT